uniref:non-specific serine/threonine protein kinase n=1 Tax=Astyanax mexicanus TaxID=7994 RepID=W5LUX8_ASTMX
HCNSMYYSMPHTGNFATMQHLQTKYKPRLDSIDVSQYTSTQVCTPLLVKNGLQITSGDSRGREDSGRVLCNWNSCVLDDVTLLEELKALFPKHRSTFSPKLDIMHQVHHPHIVEAYETYKTRKGLVIAVMEPGKTRLEDFIDDEGALPLQKAKRWFTQLLSAVVYLHEKDIVHRDINCENIILTSDLDQQLKLMDFSFSRKSRGFPELCKAPLVESCYNAPEVLRRQPYDAKKNDVWSLGITLYAMITGDLDMYQDLEIIQEFQRHPLYYPFHVDKSVREFISYILQHDPFTRPSAAEVALHPWLQTNDYRSDGEIRFIFHYYKINKQQNTKEEL